MTDHAGQDTRSLADRLNWLFDTVRTPNGGKHTNVEVANFCRDHTGEPFSEEYVSQLRRGLRENPTMRNLEALAAFFDISPAYFFDDEESEQIRAQMDLAATLRDDDVRAIALRNLTTILRDNTTVLTTDDLRLVTDMVRSITTRKAANGPAAEDEQT